MAYKAPIWEDGKSPAISAENLNNLSQAAEGAQVLYGNSAPTSSTEGAVGQFYLVVVADSDGNYPLYQCVAIANGRYTWRDTRRIPDSITSMLGIPAPGTINRALNVLANVGNLHVWEKVQTYSEPVPEVPAGYTLGAVESGLAVTLPSVSTYSAGEGIRYGDVIVDNKGVVSVSGTDVLNAYNAKLYNIPKSNSSGIWITSDAELTELLRGKAIYVGKSVGSNTTTALETVYYVSGDSNVTKATSGNNIIVTFSKLQRVIGYPYTPAIPAGTTTDYLTSTDRNAYTDGTVGNTTITYLGQLGEPSAKIEVGSYVGTGTYGSSNPNTLTFEFEPKMVIISASLISINAYTKGNFPWHRGDGFGQIGFSSGTLGDSSKNCVLVWEGNTLSWYHNYSATSQMNGSSSVYTYTAIG